MKLIFRLSGVLFLVVLMSVGLAAQTAGKGKTGAKKPSKGKPAATTKKPSPPLATWFIDIADTKPMTADDGTKCQVTLKMHLTCKTRDGQGTYSGDSTFSSVGTRSDMQAALALSANGLKIDIQEMGETPLAPLTPAGATPAPAGAATDPAKAKNSPDLEPLAPLTPSIRFEQRGKISYMWEQLRTSMGLAATNKQSASDKSAYTFTYDYILKTDSPTDPTTTSPHSVSMTVTVADGVQLTFKGKYGQEKK